jgi:hypothetical protein
MEQLEEKIQEPSERGRRLSARRAPPASHCEAGGARAATDARSRASQGQPASGTSSGRPSRNPPEPARPPGDHRPSPPRQRPNRSITARAAPRSGRARWSTPASSPAQVDPERPHPGRPRPTAQ